MGSPDQTAPDHAAPDDAAPDQSAPDQSAPDQSAPDQTAPDHAAPDHAAPTRDASRARVAHVITRLIVGGAQENTVASCARVAPAHVRSVLVTGPQAGPEGSLLSEAREAGVEVVVEDALRREIAPIQDLRAVVRLWRWLRRARPHVIHTHSSKAGVVGRAAARLAGVPVVVHTVHGWGFHEHMAAPKRLAYVLAERLAARWTDVLVVVAASDARKGLDEGIAEPGRYRLIRSGVDLEPFRRPGVAPEAMRRELGVPVDAPVVGAVGRLSPQKDPLAFVRLAASVAREHPRAWFVLVGDGPMRAETLALADELGVGDRLVLPGLRRDVHRLLAAMDVVAFTSRWEGLPRVVPQAMAAGVPIAAYGVDGIEEAVGATGAGVTVPAGDEGALAQATSALLADPTHAAACARRGRASSEGFELDRMIAQLTALYREQLASKARGDTPA